MTVVVVKDGVIATDSRVTVESEAGGIRMFHCEKLYKIPGVAAIAVAGESFSALRFVEWFRTRAAKGGKKKRDTDLIMGEADFSALVLHKTGKLEEFDKWLIPEEILLGEGKNQFYAIGCGAKAALGALHMGANAEEAVRVACKIDPLCDLPVVSLRLEEI